MGILDWIVLFGTLGFIVIYGAWKTRKNANIDDYLKGGNQMKWTTIGLSVMATQASAITFISTPGQAFDSGMGFVQNYFGLPLALIVVCAVFIPIYYKLNVYTAYEYLESRFGLKNRMFAAFLFLVQRGLAAGITIYAPAIILSTALGWDLNLTILLVGVLVIIYTVSGGSKAVSLTQKWQMTIIMLGMFIAFFMVIYNLPGYVSFTDALHIAGSMDKLEVVDFSFDPSERYTLWSGLIGGFFLALSYFGTDQSQVQRYLGGKSVYESRMGLLFNAVLKIPMQFFILMVGIMVFVFYQFQDHPVLFNPTSMDALKNSEVRAEIEAIEVRHNEAFKEKKRQIAHYLEIKDQGNTEMIDLAKSNMFAADQDLTSIRGEAKTLLADNIGTQSKDSDYVFLSFIIKYLPTGIVGLLLAVIFSAAMSSTSGELNALSSTTTIDFYKRVIKKDGSDKHYLNVSKALTLGWGLIAIGFALFAHLVENLIEAVNILGSIFYGTILGIFLVAFFIKFVKGNAVFIAALITQSVIIIIFALFKDDIAYLYLNLLGCLGIVFLSMIIQLIIGSKEEA